MNIQTVAIAGAAIDAGVRLPVPDEDLPQGCSVQDLMRSLGDALNDYMDHGMSMETDSVVRHVDEGGAAYWMRIVTDEGAIYVRAIPYEDHMELEIADAASAPPGIRPH